MGLQIIRSCTVRITLVYKAKVIIKGLRLKKSEPCWSKKETVDEWTEEEKSGAHFVFLAHLK